jgi:HAD superfamily hydrolase (TIGR01484 family)
MFKHIFADLDDTLFAKDLKISPEVKKTVNNLNPKVGFSICTARGVKKAFELTSCLQLNSLQIVENGAKIVEPDGKIIKEYCLSQKKIRQIFKITSKYPGFKTVCVKGEELRLKESQHYLEATRISLHNLKRKELKKIENQLARVPDIYYTPSVAADRPHVFSLDISDIKATKKQAVLFILKMLGLKKEEVIGIGDSYNDLPLFLVSGLKVIMGNASKDLKKFADVVAPSVKKDGVAWVIRKFIPAKH